MPRWIPSGEPSPDKKVVSFVVSKSSHPDLIEWLHTLPYGGGSNLIRSILDQVAKTGKYAPEDGPPACSTPREAVLTHPQPRAVEPIQQHASTPAQPTQAAPPVAPRLSVEIKTEPEQSERAQVSDVIDGHAAKLLQELADMC